MNYRSISIALHPDVQDRLRAHLRRLSMTQSEYVRRLIRRDLARRTSAIESAPSPPNPPAALPTAPPRGLPS